jgi:hypothetical protein
MQVLFLFDNESLLLGQIDGARLGSDCGLISFLRPQDVFRRRKDYAEREHVAATMSMMRNLCWSGSGPT